MKAGINLVIIEIGEWRVGGKIEEICVELSISLFNPLHLTVPDRYLECNPYS